MKEGGIVGSSSAVEGFEAKHDVGLRAIFRSPIRPI